MKTTEALQIYHRVRRRRWMLVGAMGCLLFLGLCIDVATGPAAVPFNDVARSLLLLGDTSLQTEVIIWRVRLPMALMAILVGGALGIAGAEMQTILENALAEPFTLGVSSAAALGAAFSIILGINIPGLAGAWVVPVNAFLFSTGALLLLQAAMRWPRADTQMLILFGIAIGFGAGTLLSLLQFVASADALQQLVFWTMGSLSRSNWTNVGVLAAALFSILPFSLLNAWKMTMLLLGEDCAGSAGVNVVKTRCLSLLRVGVLTAIAVSFVGVVGFVGLAAPHIARRLIGEDHRQFLPASLFTGALLMSFASVVSKIMVPGIVLPIGVITALIGIPFFVFLIAMRGKEAP